MFHMNVAKVDLDVARTCMLQEYVLSVLGVLDLYFECVHLDVAKVYLICCNDNIHMVQVYVFKCFRCLRRMFQLFLLNVAKVDLDVAYTCMLQEYIFKCFRCFICILQVFYLDVAYAFESPSLVLLNL